MDRIFRSQIGEPMPIGPLMAMDEMPKYLRTTLAGAAGGRAGDQGVGDPEVVVASSPGEAAYRKLFQLLGDKLDPDDLTAVQELLGELLGATDPNSNGNSALAGDRRFPNANRLRPGMAADSRGTSYEARFPNQGRLLRGTYL